jgi:hypothetical protein
VAARSRSRPSRSSSIFDADRRWLERVVLTQLPHLVVEGERLALLLLLFLPEHLLLFLQSGDLPFELLESGR